MYNLNLSETISLMELNLILNPSEIENIDKERAILSWLKELKDIKNEKYPEKTITVVADNPNNLFGYNYIGNDNYSKLKDDIAAYIIANRVTKVISTMGSGAGIATALAALELKEQGDDIELECLIPCKNYEGKRNDKEKEIYSSILKKADNVKYLAEQYSSGCIIKTTKASIDEANVILMIFKTKNKYYKEYLDYAHTKEVQELNVSLV